MPVETTAAMAAKNGWSCPSTAEARNHARLAPTAVCKMGHTPTPNRPNAPSNRRLIARKPPAGTTHVSTLIFTTKHLLRSTHRKLCAPCTQTTLTRGSWRLKGLGRCLNNLLLCCYLAVTFSGFDPCGGQFRRLHLGGAGSSTPRGSCARRTLLYDLRRV